MGSKLNGNHLLLDLHCGNIAVDFSFFHTFGVAQLMEQLDPPHCRPSIMAAPGPHPPSLPHYIAERYRADEKLSPLIIKHAGSVVVKIIDFGCAFRPGKDELPTLNPDGALGAPQCLRAPETTIATIYEQCPYINDTIPVPSTPAWSAKSDIWTLACSLNEIYCRLPNKAAIFTHAGGASHIHDVARLVGPIPSLYLDIIDAILPIQNPYRGGKRKQDVEYNWSLLVSRVMEYRHDPPRLGRNLQKPRISPKEDTIRVQALFSLMRRMLRWDPEDRISAKDALDDNFFKTPFTYSI